MQLNNTAVLRLLPAPQENDHRANKLTIAPKPAPKAEKKKKKKEQDILMPPQETCYIKPPRYDFF